MIDRQAEPAAERRIGRLLVLAIAGGFLCLAVAGGAAAWVTARIQRHMAGVEHAYQVELAIGRLRLLVEQSEAGRRGLLLTRDPAYRLVHERAVARLPGTVDRLVALSGDNAAQQVAIGGLRPLLSALERAQRRSLALVGGGRQALAVGSFAGEHAVGLLQDIRRRTDRMRDTERRLLLARDAERTRSVRVFYGVLVASALLLMVVACVTLASILRSTRDLAATRDRVQALNDTLEEQVAVRTADLRRANDEIQRFAYIVSHDLRSPLVNVMGFTAELEAAAEPLAALVDRIDAAAPDLLTPAARLAVREDLPEAVGFIRASTQKMDRLINAILRLSREGRRVLAPEEIDLAALVENVVAAMRRVVDGRGVVVEVTTPMPPLVGDRLAIEQILSNLIENASKYLQPGRPGHVTVSATRRHERVLVHVADNGRGIAPADHERIFDLFRRSGMQDQPGEGIGLAHVRSLAYRMGGLIEVTSDLGSGATFTLDLPARPVGIQEQS